MKPLVVGLTGGVASGKSQVEGMFRALGIPVLDADQTAREVVAPGTPGLAAVIETFGPEVLQADGQLDRRQLRERVFADPAERQRLEALLHPRIGAALQAWCAAQTAPYVVLSVAILLESRFRTLVDHVLVVDVPETVQEARLIARDGVTPALARQMLAAQMGRDARREAADDVIDNSGPLEVTRAQVEHCHRNLLQRAAGRGPGGV